MATSAGRQFFLFSCTFLAALLCQRYAVVDGSPKNVFKSWDLLDDTEAENYVHMEVADDKISVDEDFNAILEKGVTKDTVRRINRHTVLQAEANLQVRGKDSLRSQKSGDVPSNPFDPGQPAKGFTVRTLEGELTYPSDALKSDTPILVHVFDNRSSLVECMWTSNESLSAFIANSPNNTHYIFLSPSEDAEGDVKWMKNQIENIMRRMMINLEVSPVHVRDLQSRLHYVTTPTYNVGNWIPAVMKYYACLDHGCGYDQILFESVDLALPPVVVKRLDARYDWLPSPVSVFQDATEISSGGDGCQKSESVKDLIALVSWDGQCSFYEAVLSMQQSGALGVIFYSQPGGSIQDMNCHGDECDSRLSIPATMMPYNGEILQRLQAKQKVTATFQNTPSDNFFFGIDGGGQLAEIGWLLYPSLQFLTWQAQWFNFKAEVYRNLSKEALVVSVFNFTIMQGDTGVVATTKLPKMEEMSRYSLVELDMSLSCPGSRDETCPPWDHTVQLYVCCDKTSPLCGMELGRWITPFRRRIGRWLTDVTPLLPLFTSNTCNLTMKTVPWAKAWKPALNLRLSGYMSQKDPRSHSNNIQPYQITPLFRGGTFNKSYNAKYSPIKFTVPDQAKKVAIVAVITGHGSDENGCGEFCPTSHHFVVNGNHSNNRSFDIAGTQLGCADNVPTGVEPNEHGTWLYGRDGWCDGREVDPWVIDITSQVTKEGANNVTYYGWYNGGDPDPSEEPGYIIMYSYLVFYRTF